MFATVSPEKEELDDYFLWNLKINQKFLEDYEVYAMANNIFDEDYDWSSGYPGQGRSFWAGVSMRF